MAPPVVQTSSLPVITSLLRRTNMIAPLTRQPVQPQRESGELTVLVEDLGVKIGSFGIITRRRRKLSPGAQIVIEVLRETDASFYRQPVALRSDYA
jgi:DNA-binding transcriptional LysR family regulator